jgi:YYY domain-containing protein
LIYVLLFWLILEVLGWLAVPIAFRFLRWLPDRGFTFARSLGLLIASYLLWLGASTNLLRNDLGGILFACLLVASIATWIFFRGQDGDAGPIRQSLPNFLREHKGLVLTVEILFALAFLAWVGVRAYAPDKIMSAGGEKFMEMAFLNGILNSPHFPPMDVWLSGFAISYYYFGYVMMALMTRLSGAPAGIGFDLYDAVLFALTAIGVFGVVYNLVAGSLKARAAISSQTHRNQPILYGLLGSLLVVVMGNLEGLLESLYSKGVLPQSFWKWIDIPGLMDNPVTGAWYPQGGWWQIWWHASRVLQDRDLVNRPVGIQPITEFPSFSFLLGDNHPHVLALPFVLLCIALALNLLYRQMRLARSAPTVYKPAARWNPAGVLGGNWSLFLFYALCLGSLGFLNTWDMPIYIGLVVLAFAVGELAAGRRVDRELIRRVLVLGAGLLLAAVLLYFFFYISFGSQASGILPYVFPPTRLPQYLVMFGFFIFVVTFFLTASLVKQARMGDRTGLGYALVRAWLWIVLVCVLIFGVVLAAAAFSSLGQQLLQRGLDNPAVQAVTGGLGLAGSFSAMLGARLANPWLFLLLSILLALAVVNLFWPVSHHAQDEPEWQASYFSGSELFVYLLIFVGIALTFSVEFFYLRDVFMARMNTVFKFYYQGWVMLGIASAYAVWWVMNQERRFVGAIGRGVFATVTVLLLAAGLVYPLMAGYNRVDGFTQAPNLDGTINLARSNPDDWAAIHWLQTQGLASQAGSSTGIPVILEAPGDSFRSYVYEGRISAFSGFPTVLGWGGHENQWRGNYIEPAKREADIQTIFSSLDGAQLLDLLHKWDVKYVIVGQTELNYIQQLCSDTNRACSLPRVLRNFETTLTPVFQQGNMTIYEVPGN